MCVCVSRIMCVFRAKTDEGQRKKKRQSTFRTVKLVEYDSLYVGFFRCFLTDFRNEHFVESK